MARADQTQLIDVFSEQAKRYDTTVQYFTPLATELIARVGLRPGQDVLDVGCGRGAVLFQAVEAVGGSGSVVGIDIAAGMAAATSADVHARGLTNVTVLQMDGYAPEFPAASFDHVLGSMSIIMIPDLITALRNYHTLLRDGGTLGFTSPAVGADARDWKIGPFHLRKFLADTLREEPPQLASMLEPFDQMEPHRMLGNLRAAGFREPRAIDVTTIVRGRSGEDLVAWTFTHGTRTIWNLVPEPRRTEYATEWAARIDAEFGGSEPAYETVTRVFLASK
jgi:ubiquinone/menaquinone biosynthesis C-methylase UbiE